MMKYWKYLVIYLGMYRTERDLGEFSYHYQSRTSATAKPSTLNLYYY